MCKTLGRMINTEMRTEVVHLTSFCFSRMSKTAVTSTKTPAAVAWLMGRLKDWVL